ncbi:Rdx family protein [Alsobacter soli]|nr:Rdx family protein [Alsobacter soli]
MRVRLQQQGVGDVTMAPGTSGQFDVTADGALLYSKHLMGRFPMDREIDHWARTGEPEAAFAKVIGAGRRP